MSTSDKSFITTFRFYWQYVKHYPLFVAGLSLMIPITIVANNFIPPLILAHALNRLTTGDYIKGDLWQSFSTEIIAYTSLILASSMLLFRLVDLMVWKLEGNILKDLSRSIFKHLINQGANFHANKFGGSLVSQTNKALGAYVRMADTFFFNTYPLIIGVLAVSVIMWSKSPIFVVALIILSVMYIVVSIWVSQPVRIRGEIHAKAESKQTGYLADAITNVLAIKSFSGEKYEIAAFNKVSENTRRRLMDVMVAHRKQMLYFSSMMGIISAVAFVAALVSVVEFNANIATAFLVLSYTSAIVTNLFQFSNQGLRNFNRSIGDASEMIKIMGTEQEIKDPVSPERLKMSRGEIEFNNVTFAHKDADESIFKELNIKIKPGEKVGLVGHSGSGKTSLTKLLLRFSDINDGEILIDGQNIASVTQSELHSAISYVPQEPLLFHRTIKENISYGKANALEQEIGVVARKANAEEFIKTLPNGYDTLVGERGVKLSGGQRQRIAIARAMLKNAPILVLDEATSALDSESEALIQDALWKLMEGRTAIVIAHRLSTIQRMDRIIVLKDGQIVEEGTHKELVNRNGVYSSLWARQSGGFLEED